MSSPLSLLSSLPGEPPPVPPWGQEQLSDNPHIAPRAGSTERPGIAVVIGAAGALGPDVVQLLRDRGHVVVGLDVQGSYLVPGVAYRHLDIADTQPATRFFDALARLLQDSGLPLAGVYNLATIQTSPISESAGSREALTRGVSMVLDLLTGLPGDVRLFHMSTAEVYGAPPGAPYAEGHDKRPFNAYARMKWEEEQVVIAAHGRPTRGGQLHVAALRCWTISMVSYDDAGEIRATRNFNDPFITIAQHLASAGVRVPVVEPQALCQFHPSEEIAEQAMCLAEAPLDSPTWGRALNSVGQPATHGELAALLGELAKDSTESPWWAGPARLVLGHARLPRPILSGTARLLELSGGALGARDVAGRLPFLYRSTHMNSATLTSLLGDRLTVPEGSSSVEATRRLILGLFRGGPDAVNVRRYQLY